MYLLIINHYPRICELYIQDKNAFIISRKISVRYDDEKVIERAKAELRKLITNV